MSPVRNGPNSAPDGPPLACIARCGEILHVTVLHGAAADILWQSRQRLTAVHGCSALRLEVLEPPGNDGATIVIHWHRPLDSSLPIRPRRLRLRSFR
jgi:hypothetical protein